MFAKVLKMSIILICDIFKTYIIVEKIRPNRLVWPKKSANQSTIRFGITTKLEKKKSGQKSMKLVKICQLDDSTLQKKIASFFFFLFLSWKIMLAFCRCNLQLRFFLGFFFLCFNLLLCFAVAAVRS